jgi:hypothetical protein
MSTSGDRSCWGCLYLERGRSLDMDPITEADMKEHAVSGAVPAQPAPAEDEPDRDQPAGEVSLGGMYRAG